MDESCYGAECAGRRDEHCILYGGERSEAGVFVSQLPLILFYCCVMYLEAMQRGGRDS